MVRMGLLVFCKQTPVQLAAIGTLKGFFFKVVKNRDYVVKS